MKANNKKSSRREFLKTSSKAALAFSILPLGSSFINFDSKNKLKLVLVGTGSRGIQTWGKTLNDSYGEYIEFVGLCDINKKRLKFGKEYMGIDIPLYHSDDFDKMIKETKPDTVIITTPDSFHEEYIIRSLRLGCDVLSEKPLATEALQCENILKVEKETGKKVNTTFNMRHGSINTEVKKTLLKGEIGEIVSAEFHEFLDYNHGADYFRRWHRKKDISGTLLVHKASHHFDQLNWWLDSVPEEVNAYGKLAYYGKNNSFRGKDCRSCQHTQVCKHYWDINKDSINKGLYIDCESEDGYIRDTCVWAEDTDIYDTHEVQVKYTNGIMLNYSLHAFMPYEGQQIAFNGKKGRLDVRIYQSQPWKLDYEAEFRLTMNFGETKIWYINHTSGGHGGADEELKDLLFIPGKIDPLGKKAGSKAGVLSSLIGIAARESIESGKRIKLNQIIDFDDLWK